MTRPGSLAIARAVFVFGFFALRPAAAVEPVTVLAYNVQNWLNMDRPTAGKRAPTSKPDSEKAAAVAIIAAHHPDVVGVLEMGDRAELDNLCARLAARGLNYPHAEWLEGVDSERHIALLSRYPIVARASQGHVAFDVNGQPNSIQRGILDVTIEPEPGYRVRLLGLHLKSRLTVPGVDEATLRAREAWFVRQTTNAILKKNPDTRLLVFGDLNDTRDEYPVRTITGPRGAGHLSAIPVADSRNERWTHYYETADEYARIDFFLASKSLLPEIDLKKSGIDDSPAWNTASDHRAIFVTIRPTRK